MRQSCTHEVHEEYRATLASCINFSDPGAELDCRDEARTIRHEDLEGCRAQRSARRAVCELLQEDKYFLSGVGFVLGIGLEDGEITGETDELVCIGGSLDILADPDCGIEDVDKLREELCRLSPDAFCEVL